MSVKQVLVISIILGLFALGIVLIYSKWQENSIDTLLLIKSDNAIKPNLIEGWKNIAEEEGLHLEVKSNNEFLYSKEVRPTYKGIILADTISSRISQALVKKLKSYVESGGYLMLVYDAGTQDLDGNFSMEGSLFSKILNISYAIGLKEEYGTQSSFIGHNKTDLESLGVPPGKCIIKDPTDTSITSFCAISTYGYGAIKYLHFTTEAMNKDMPLLLTTSDRQFIAGEIPVGKGKILFVNLPLTFLWSTTDSMFLHIFLQYFASEMLHLPVLSSVPNGIGGLIMNLHVESKSDINTFPILKKIGVFEQGPYSIDYTAGPDSRHFGDNLGTDLLNNPIAQYWMLYLSKLGNAIGSDGGWLHDYYGNNVSELNPSAFQKYLTMNIEAIEKVLGKKIFEYVPSSGNQPNWATRYLEKEHFLGYYSLSNTGVGPTRNFRDGIFDDPHLWSFSPLPYGQYAAIRDFGFVNLPVAGVTEWLIQSTKFAASRHASYLIYYHPSDFSFFPQYLDSIKKWLNVTNTLASQKSFHWYSMVNLAEFLNSRREVSWKVINDMNYQIIKATHPISLRSQSWLIRKDACSKPEVTAGEGDVREDLRYWIVTAGDVQQFEFRCLQF